MLPLLGLDGARSAGMSLGASRESFHTKTTGVYSSGLVSQRQRVFPVMGRAFRAKRGDSREA